MKQEIENHAGIVKDSYSNAILAADLNAYQNHINKKRLNNNNEKRIATLESRVEQLERILKANGLLS